MLVVGAEPPLILGIFGVIVLVAGFVGVGALAWWVIKKAPPDGSDVGMAPEEPREGDRTAR